MDEPAGVPAAHRPGARRGARQAADRPPRGRTHRARSRALWDRNLSAGSSGPAGRRGRIFTVGHSIHPLDAFVALLRAPDICVLADVRAYPRSRRQPQFNQDTLAAELPERGIAYRHYAALGGRRRPRPDSPNAGWENDAFRAYADHALTDAFAAALEDLADQASGAPTAVMCAEGLWWQCHRRLIADRLVTTGWTVEHIGPDGALTEHTLPLFAQPQPDGTVLYPPPAQLFE